MAMSAEAGGRRLSEEIGGHANAAEIEEYNLDIVDARHSYADPFISDALVAAIGCRQHIRGTRQTFHRVTTPALVFFAGPRPALQRSEDDQHRSARPQSATDNAVP